MTQPAQHSQLIEIASEEAFKVINKHAVAQGTLTIGQVKEKIRGINSEVRKFDLIIESRTFRELAQITKAPLPQLNDRILLALKYLFQAIELTDEDSMDYLRKVLHLIFEWDKPIFEEVNQNIEDLKLYVNIKSEEDFEDFAKILMEKYKFEQGMYEAYLQLNKITPTKDKLFDLAIPFITEIGPIISIYKSIKEPNSSSDKQLDVILGILSVCIHYLHLPTLLILEFIPNLLRAIVRQTGVGEEDALRMDIKEIAKIAKGNPIGEKIIWLSKNIFKQKQERIEKAIIGKRLWLELKIEHFWDSPTHRYRYGILEQIFESDI
jgi:hypothetical protein